MNIDNSIKRMLNKSKGKGASSSKQKQWKMFSPLKKNIMRKKYLDTDGDRIPNKWDCQPRNVMRQDSRPNKLQMQRIQKAVYLAEGERSFTPQEQRNLLGTLKRFPGLITNIEQRKSLSIGPREQEKHGLAMAHPITDSQGNVDGTHISLKLQNQMKPIERAINLRHELKHAEQYEENPYYNISEETQKQKNIEWGQRPEEQEAQKTAFKFAGQYRGQKPVEEYYDYMANESLKPVTPMTPQEYEEYKNKIEKKKEQAYKDSQKIIEQNIQQGMEQL